MTWSKRVRQTMMLTMVLALGCGDVAPDGELDPNDPNTVDPDAPLAAVTDMQPELMMLGWGEHRIWGSSPDNLFMTADSGMIAHFDGERWRPMELPEELANEYYFTSIFGLSDTDVYVGTSSGTIGHYNGTDWRVFDLNTYGVSSIWGLASDDLYALGRGGVYHYDGVVWSRIETGLRRGLGWGAICGTGPRDIFLAGSYTADPFDSSTTIGAVGYFDGVSWTEHAVPEGTKSLHAAHCPATRRAFAVGRDGAIVYFDGVQATQKQRFTSQRLTAIWGTGGQIFAAGSGAMGRFDGTQFRAMPVPEPIHPTHPVEIDSIFGFGANDFYIAGSGVYHFDGSEWETTLPFSTYTTGLWASGPDDVMVLGQPNYRFDGEKFSLERITNSPDETIRAAWGPADQTFAVGYSGAIYLYDGESWGRMTSNTDKTLNAVWGSSPDDVFAVGAGIIVHYDGSSWSEMPMGVDAAGLTGVWGAASDDVYAAGYNGLILHYDGEVWSPKDTGTESLFYNIFGFSSDHILAPSTGGLFRGNGLTWRLEELDISVPGGDVEALHGTAPDNVFGAEFNWVAHYDGSTWTELPHHGPRSGVEAVLVVGEREVYVASSSALLRYRVD